MHCPFLTLAILAAQRKLDEESHAKDVSDTLSVPEDDAPSVSIASNDFDPLPEQRIADWEKNRHEWEKDIVQAIASIAEPTPNRAMRRAARRKK